MMMRIVTILTVLLLSVGCDSRLTGDIDLNYVGDRLTMVGYISPTEARIRAGRTQPADASFYSSALLPPDDMTIELLDAAGTLVRRLTLIDRQFFVAQDLQFEPGSSYRVRAKAAGFPTAESSLLQIPEFIPDFKMQPIKDIDDLGIPGTVAGQIDFSFTDQDPARNFYFVNIGLKKETSVTYNPPTWVIDGQWQERCFNTGIFSDDCFNQRSATLQYGFSKVISELRGRPKGDTMLLRFGLNTPELYHYTEASRNGSDELIQGINEPPLTYTNLTNGYGVVFTQNWKEYKVKLR